MPRHDGRGHFSPSMTSDSDFEDFSQLARSASATRSLTASDLNFAMPSTQPGQLDWDDVEDDQLSIPSSLSLGSACSRSQRSVF